MNDIIRPSKKELEARIAELENMDYKNSSIDAIKDKLTLLSKGYVLTSPVLHPGLELFRGVVYKTKPMNVSYLSYPPADLTSNGRANREKESVFYCSTIENIPFFELGLSEGDKLVVSKWKTTRKMIVNNIGYTDSTFSKLDSTRNNPKWGNPNDENPEIEVEENILVQEFFARMFSQKITNENKHLYNLTIAIAEKHYLSDIFQGLLYPTIPMKANGDNFVLKTEFIDSGGLKFEDVQFIEITNVKDFAYDINRLDWANSISEKGDIEWKGRLPQWTIKEKGGELKVVAENGKWVAYDKDGKVVPPS